MILEARGVFLLKAKGMITSMHYGATKATFQLAEQLRNNLTPSEIMLWNFLSRNALGYRFRCQHPVNKYVVDFYCHPLKLIIEVDGGVHNEVDVTLNDLQREMKLLSFGLNLIRFNNDIVVTEIDAVILEIKNTINSLMTIKNGRPL